MPVAENLSPRALSRSQRSDRGNRYSTQIPANEAPPASSYQAASLLSFTTPMAAGTYEDRTIDAEGAAVGDLITVVPDGDPGAGAIWSAWISAVDTITVRLANPTSSSLTLTDRTWRAAVIPSQA